MQKNFICLALAAVVIGMAPATFAQDNGALPNMAVEVTFWNSVKDSRDPNELQAYLNKYPKGQFAELAAMRKQNLEKRKSALDSTEGELNNRASKIANAESKSGSTDIDPKFDKYLKGLKSVLYGNKRPNVSEVLPVLLPASEFVAEQRVKSMANQLFRAPFPSFGAISIGPKGHVAFGVSQLALVQLAIIEQPDNVALSECENRRKGMESLLPKCEIFFRSRTLDKAVLIKMMETVRGTDYDAWVRGLNDSLSNSKFRLPTTIR